MQGNNIKAIRNAAGLTQTGLARVLGIADLRTIRRWEKDEMPVSGPAGRLIWQLGNGTLPEEFFDPDFSC